MITRPTRRVLLLVPLFLMISPEPRAHAQSACAAAQIKAAGKKVAGKANCYSKAYKKGDPVSADCLAKVEAKFSTDYAKAVAKGDCPGDATAVSVEGLVDDCVGELTGAVNPPVAPNACGTTVECGDGIDNDGDGLVDGADDECVSACDNSESNYDNTIAALSYACTVDCFFDLNSGSGDDDCTWTHSCDPHEIAPNFDPAGSTCAYDPGATVGGVSCTQMQSTQSATCSSVCGHLVPNGCDCFGCCDMGSGNYAWIGSRDSNGIPTCTRSTANDPTKCRPCTPVSACFNPCDQCELCIGRTDSSGFPPSCNGIVSCPAGSTPCAAGCPDGEYCVTGCCQPLPQ